MGPFSPPTDLASAVLRTPASRALAVLTAFLLLAVVLLEPVGLSLASYRRILLVGGAGLLLLGGWVFSLRRQVRSRREAQERFESLFEHNVDAVVSLDLEGRIREANPAFQSMCGRDAGEIAGESFSSLLVAPDRNRAEEHLEEALEGRAHTLHTALTRPDGERVELELKSVPAIVDGEVRGVYQIAKDVTAFKEFEQELEHRALHDQLTGLPNRALFGDRIDQALRRHEREEVDELALLLLDLDRFRLVNES
ncbi:MAG: PAS domain S-box protein, partial [Gemmatimonadota bacterium]